MTAKNYLIAILVISIVGILFSGYLSFKEFSQKTCSTSGGNCGTQLFGLPVCVYGLIMYLIVFVIALVGIIKG